MSKRITTALLVLAAALGGAAPASASTPQLGPAPVPEVKWIEWHYIDWINDADEASWNEAYHNTKAAAEGAGYPTTPHRPRP